MRSLTVSSGVTSPVGWAVLPVFRPGTRFVDSGYYHLPLFQGQPSTQILQQLAAKESEEAITEALKSSKLRFTSESASVLVRLIDGQRFGQLAEPATDEAKARELHIPPYTTPKVLAAMRKQAKGGKTYAKLKPRNEEEEKWLLSLRQKAAKSTTWSTSRTCRCAPTHPEPAVLLAHPPSTWCPVEVPPPWCSWSGSSSSSPPGRWWSSTTCSKRWGHCPAFAPAPPPPPPAAPGLTRAPPDLPGGRRG